MKKVILFFILSQISIIHYGQIIADHTIIEKFDDIPQYYIDKVKQFWLTIPGESHSQAYRTGLILLASSYPNYAVSVIESGTPEAYTTSHLRTSRGTWGDVNNATGWIYDYGEEDWFTSELAINRTKAGITYCNTHNLSIAAIGLGWCWDPGINFTDYISATQEYIDYCVTNSYDTKIVFTTGTVDNSTEEVGYIKHLGYESIRNYVATDPTRILFDYADILCYDENGSSNTTTWNGHTYPIITATNLGGGEIGHISSTGAIRLGKAMWWILARIAGWNGGTTNIPVTGVTVTGAGGATIITTDNSTLQLSAAVTPSNATNQTVTWSLVNGTGQASISATGLVTAVNNGTVTARATANDGSGVSGILEITISNQVIPVTGVSVSPTIADISIGGTHQLTATVLPANASNKSVTWNSGNTSIATVNAGLVIGVAVGSTTITVTIQDGNFTASCMVTVMAVLNTYTVLTTQVPDQSQNDNPCELGMRFTSSQSGQITKIRYYKTSGEGGTHVGRIWSANGTLLATASFSDETSSGWQEVALSSPYTIEANTIYVVSVNSNNNWAGTKDGLNSMITNGPLSTVVGNNGVYTYTLGSFPNATTDNKNYFRDITFSLASGGDIIPAAGITVTGAGGATIITTDNGTLQLSAAVTPSNATNQTVTWSLVNGTGQASISATGLVTAVNNGTVTARATANDGSGVSGILEITISNQVIPVTGVSVSPTIADISIGGTHQLTATVLPANASNKSVTWNSGNTSIATVNAGLVIGVAVGSTTITVTTQDGNFTASCMVTVMAVLNTYTVLTTQVPDQSQNDNPCELGMRFTSSQSGQITKIRYYKTSGEGGTHVGRIWSANGTLLATASFSDETSSGWQEVALSSPYTIEANTIYVVSVNSNNNWVGTKDGLNSTITNGPLSTVVGNNGVYTYTLGSFPNATTDNKNYFRDITFSLASGGDIIPAAGITVTGAGGATIITTDNGTLQLSAAVTPSNATNKTVTWSLVNGTGQASISATGLVTAVNNGTVTARATANDGSGVSGILEITISNQVIPVTGVSVSPTIADISIGGTQQLTATVLPANASNKSVTWNSGNTSITTVNAGLVIGVAVGSTTITVTTQDGNFTASCVVTVMAALNTYTVLTTQVPDQSQNDNPCELGMRFTSSLSGQITKIRYYKTSGERGTHVGRIWSANGTLLATASFSDETSSGWQEVALSSPYTIEANTIYVVSVNSNNNWAGTKDGLNSMITNGPLSTVVGNNGVYTYTLGSFPNATSDNKNYFRDLTFSTSITKGLLLETMIKPFEGNVTERLRVKVYPNPASQFLNIEIDDTKSQEFEISLYNTLSHKIIWIKTNETYISLNIEGISKGLYILIIQSNGEKIVKKVIIE